ncbi:MAG: hypothetical protein KJZ93_17935 [Caldilineaceae bacterium]|nr:hypothetical protein [Caldilineaceae bacterium]
METKFAPVHPGEILLEEFLKPLWASANIGWRRTLVSCERQLELPPDGQLEMPMESKGNG